MKFSTKCDRLRRRDETERNFCIRYNRIAQVNEALQQQQGDRGGSRVDGASEAEDMDKGFGEVRGSGDRSSRVLACSLVTRCVETRRGIDRSDDWGPNFIDEG